MVTQFCLVKPRLVTVRFVASEQVQITATYQPLDDFEHVFYRRHRSDVRWFENIISFLV